MFSRSILLMASACIAKSGIFFRISVQTLARLHGRPAAAHASSFTFHDIDVIQEKSRANAVTIVGIAGTLSKKKSICVSNFPFLD